MSITVEGSFLDAVEQVDVDSDPMPPSRRKSCTKSNKPCLHPEGGRLMEKEGKVIEADGVNNHYDLPRATSLEDGFTMRSGRSRATRWYGQKGQGARGCQDTPDGYLYSWRSATEGSSDNRGQ